MSHQKLSISDRRATYPLHERLKIYGPDAMARRLNEKPAGKLIVQGVNILNKSSLDTDTVMDRIKQRKETHNRVERRRRDVLNTLVNELAHTMTPDDCSEKLERAKVLRQAIHYIRTIQAENDRLRNQLSRTGYDSISLDTKITLDETKKYDNKSPS